MCSACASFRQVQGTGPETASHRCRGQQQFHWYLVTGRQWNAGAFILVILTQAVGRHVVSGMATIHGSLQLLPPSPSLSEQCSASVWLLAHTFQCLAKHTHSSRQHTVMSCVACNTLAYPCCALFAVTSVCKLTADMTMALQHTQRHEVYH